MTTKTDRERAELFLNYHSDTHDHTCGSLSHDCFEELAAEFDDVREEGIRAARATAMLEAARLAAEVVEAALRNRAAEIEKGGA